MRSAHFRRCKQSRLNAVAHLEKLSSDLAESESKVVAHVLEENKSGPDLSHDSGHIGPQVPRIVFTAALTRDRKWLAGVASSDDIHLSAPRAAIEGLEIVPYRSAIQGLVFHPRHESGRGEGFPLNVANGSVILSECDGNSEVESSNPGT